MTHSPLRAHRQTLNWTTVRPHTCSEQTCVIHVVAVITLGAGVQWHEAYDAAYAHNRVLVGGLSPDVSVGAAGGWIQGGGHSALSPKYGLGECVVQDIRMD